MVLRCSNKRLIEDVNIGRSGFVVDSWVFVERTVDRTVDRGCSFLALHNFVHRDRGCNHHTQHILEDASSDLAGSNFEEAFLVLCVVAAHVGWVGFAQSARLPMFVSKLLQLTVYEPAIHWLAKPKRPL